MKPASAERSSLDLIPSLRDVPDSLSFARGSNPAHFEAPALPALGEPPARPTLRIEASELIRLLEIDHAQAEARESRRRMAVEIPSLAHARSVRSYDVDADDRHSATVVVDVDFPEITIA